MNDTPVNLNGSELGEFGVFDQLMGVWIPGIVSVLGILGNILALAVLSRDRVTCPTFVTLKALASTDLILLIGAMLQQVIPLLCLTSDNTSAFCRHQGYPRVLSWPVICMAQMNSIWLTVLISTERFIAICFPLRAVRSCTVSKVRRVIMIITTISVLYNIPKFFEFRTVTRVIQPVNMTYTVMDGTALRQNTAYRYGYNTVLYCLVIYAIPLFILTIFNLRIVQEIKKARRNWEALNRSRQREMNATTLPLVIVIVFFICGTQAFIAFVLDAIFVIHTTSVQIYTAVVNLLVVTNSAINFILLYAFGSRFRKLLVEMICCRRKEKIAYHNSITMTESFR